LLSQRFFEVGEPAFAADEIVLPVLLNFFHDAYLCSAQIQLTEFERYSAFNLPLENVPVIGYDALSLVWVSQWRIRGCRNAILRRFNCQQLRV